ncbi:sucrase ferredoxin [Epidermidibacterium keratini]|uniref:Sucrase ferredoxin n=1 Tax=Epidermidibacterium keratini TaxID=1891644 RepID=A0A7L4YL48_9ACTN|nr:sucrase ferredoxin [Epidermidibacterium keratini]QHB99781.1 sucrase ferredoxin [Epidermidibacterium keratini]
MSDPFRCATSARERGDDLGATAVPVRTWVLVEYAGGWPIKGFADLDIDRAVRAEVHAAAVAAGARIQLVRRHGRQPERAAHRWAVLQHDGLRQQWGTWERDDELRAIIPALSRQGEPGHPPVLLVCTHGVHDVCCAVRGRPVAAALADRWSEQAWECDHVGGDRFAANLVVAPGGYYFGGLDPETAVQVVDAYDSGRIFATYLRGSTTTTAPGQAAMIEAVRRFGPVTPDSLKVVDMRRDDDRVWVRLAGSAPLPASMEAEVVARRTAAARLTCRATRETNAVVYDVVSLTAR